MPVMKQKSIQPARNIPYAEGILMFNGTGADIAANTLVKVAAGAPTGHRRLPITQGGHRGGRGAQRDRGHLAAGCAAARPDRVRSRGGRWLVMTTPETERLDAMLTRLKLTAIRERLDTLLDEAARRELTLRETLAYLCEQEVAHKEQRRIQMGLSIARFPFLRTLEGFDFSAQPAVDPGQIRELACGRWIANGDALLLLK